MQIQFVRGDIVDIDLSGAVGVEKQNNPTTGARPCLVVQNDDGNAVSPMTIVVPLTDADQFKGLPVQVLVSAAELGFPGSKESVIECGHVRSIDAAARIKAHRGRLAPAALRRVGRALAISLGLLSARPRQNSNRDTTRKKPL